MCTFFCIINNITIFDGICIVCYSYIYSYSKTFEGNEK